MDIYFLTDMTRITEIQNPKKQNEKKMMLVTKVVLVGAAMIFGLATGTVGLLSQEVQAARCLDCDTRLADEGTGAVPACPNGIFSCPPWLGGHGEYTCDGCPPETGEIKIP